MNNELTRMNVNIKFVPSLKTKRLFLFVLMPLSQRFYQYGRAHVTVTVRQLARHEKGDEL